MRVPARAQAGGNYVYAAIRLEWSAAPLAAPSHLVVHLYERRHLRVTMHDGYSQDHHFLDYMTRD